MLVLIKVEEAQREADWTRCAARRLMLDKRAYRTRPAVWGDTPPAQRAPQTDSQ